MRSPERTPPRTIVEFCAFLRTFGLSIGTGDVLAFTAASAKLEPGRLSDVYWAGRITLARDLGQIALYDKAFSSFFLGVEDGEEQRAAMTAVRGRDSVITVPAGEEMSEGEEEQPSQLGRAAASVTVNRRKSFADCSEEELAQIRRIIKSLRVAPPVRASRRHRGAPKGHRLDLRRMARKTIQNHGDPPRELAWLRRRPKQRPLVLILDISGSMADYSRNLLQFAYSTRRGAGRVEVFCFGTRLTRITNSLKHRDIDAALALAGKEVVDWAGGTQIGASLDTFVRLYARRGMARGAIVVICSDGLDRGDPAMLDRALDRLGRLCHRIVWMNPMKGDSEEDFATASLGMSVALPHTDLLWSGHNLASLEEFAEALPNIR
ncbi:MAG: VWA domain-containing protein [Acidimicrobiia bacterium]|nr:VWA domain-containing protein [Acidimicrobiia bacterium]